VFYFKIVFDKRRENKMLWCDAGESSHGGVRTFAIIIGSLAGAAILIIFLAFMTKICGRQGK